jgi:short-subunit dehydrogenase
MFSYRGKTALITGATSGIGEAFAQILAAHGMNLLLVARSEDKLRAMAHALSEQYGIRAECIPVNLGHVNAAQEVYRQTQTLGMTVDLLVNNAGMGTYGRFETLDSEQEHEEIMLNIAALVDLTHAFVPAMVERQAGGVMNVASLAAFQAVPYQAVYGATKAFVLSFSLALWAEYRKTGVRIVALCPGTTATNFFADFGADVPSLLSKGRNPPAVARTGLRALEQGHPYAVDGRRNAFVARITHMAPLSLTARVAEKLMRPRNPEVSPKNGAIAATHQPAHGMILHLHLA